MKKIAIIDKHTNTVVNLALWNPEEYPDLSAFGNYRYEYVEYDPNIHPWGQYGSLKIEVGPDWKEKYNAIKPLEIDPHLQEEINNAG